jgi:hypothetical protein
VLKIHVISSNCTFSLKIVETVKERNWIQESRYKSRGSVYMFAPMVNFNVMAEVGETPP